jgi:DNA-binding XRE family transcriptional regulator
MIAAEYKALRIALAHTQQSLANVLKLDRVTIARRETGKLPITAEAEISINALKKKKQHTT